MGINFSSSFNQPIPTTYGELLGNYRSKMWDYITTTNIAFVRKMRSELDTENLLQFNSILEIVQSSKHDIFYMVVNDTSFSPQHLVFLALLIKGLPSPSIVRFIMYDDQLCMTVSRQLS